MRRGAISDADFGWFGLLIGNSAKAGPLAGIVLMLLVGLVILGAAILWQRKVVDTGWDPGAERDKLLHPDGTSARPPEGYSTPTGSLPHAKISPPAGAPTPPPPPES